MDTNSRNVPVQVINQHNPSTMKNPVNKLSGGGEVYTCFPFINKPGALRPGNQLILPALIRQHCQPEAKDFPMGVQGNYRQEAGKVLQKSVPCRTKTQPASERIKGFAQKNKENYPSSFLDGECIVYISLS